MKQKIIIALIGLFAIAAVTTLADARPGKRGHRGIMSEKMATELNLTDAQKDKLKTLRSKHQKEMVKLQAAAKIARIDLGDVLHQDNPKESDVKSKIAASNAAQNKVTEARIMNRLETKKVFTPEQLKKMEELKSQHHRRKGMHKGRRGHSDQNFQGRGFRGHRGMMPGNFEAEPATEAPATNM